VYLRGGYLQAQCAPWNIDDDDVTVFDRGNGPALGGLRRDVADEAAVVRSRESPIGDYRSRERQTSPIEHFHYSRHFAHTGAALGAFVPYQKHHAWAYFSGDDRFGSRFFRVEADGGASESLHRFLYRNGLGDRAVGREIAVKHSQAAPWMPGIAQRTNDLILDCRKLFEDCPPASPGAGHRIEVQQR